jgi:hypothetical protein
MYLHSSEYVDNESVLLYCVLWDTRLLGSYSQVDVFSLRNLTPNQP